MERSESKYFITAGKMDEALIQLLSEKEFEYVTVKEICERAGVNRSTFYLHYETVTDLLGESMEYLTRQFLDYFKEDSKDFVGKIPQMKLSELNFVKPHFLIPYLNYVKDNRRVFQATLAHPEALQAIQKYNDLYKYIINPVMERFKVPEGKRLYYNAFFLEGMIAVIQVWLKGDCKEPTEEIADIIESLVARN